MKKTLVILLAIIGLSACQDNISENVQEITIGTRSATNTLEYYYWCNEEKIPLRILTDKYFVLTETTTSENLVQEFEKTGQKALSFRRERNFSYIEGISDNKFEIFKKAHSYIVSGGRPNTKDKILYSTPFYKNIQDEEIGITNEFSVILKNDADLPKLKHLAEENGVLFLGKEAIRKEYYALACTIDSKGNALEMANLFYETGLFEAANPEMLTKISPGVIMDPAFPDQWNLHNTTNLGNDINYLNAYSLGFPHIDDVIVAVIDNGVVSHHPDLPLYHLSFDAHTLSTPSVVYGSHGTNCAALIGAQHNNEGIAGIAPGVKLMPISIKYDADPGDGWTSSADIARGIRWAVNNGADILSCSWGNGGSSVDINREIQYALTEGRDENRGCIVVFATMNDSRSTVSYPANSNPGILAVGNMTSIGKRNGSSNYGKELDIVAPASHIPTLSTNLGTTYFSGTSAACPQVAGVAALILSANPNLTSKQVGDIIELTAQKVGGYGYSLKPDRPNGTWHSEMGYGLVDAYAAVALAPHFSVMPQSISGPESAVWDTAVSYSVSTSGLQAAGITFNGWSVVPSAAGDGWASSNYSSTTFNVTFTGMGEYTVKANFTLPGNIPYSLTKIVNVPVNLITPQIAFLGGDPSPIGRYGVVSAGVTNPQYVGGRLMPGMSFEWQVNGETFAEEIGGYGAFPNNGLGSSFALRCRSHLRNYVSEWSNTLYVTVGPGMRGQPLSQPSRQELERLWLEMVEAAREEAESSRAE